MLLTLLLITNNNYAIDVVRSQIADANRNLLTKYVADLENQFEEANNYLYGLVLQDPDIQVLSLMNETEETYFAKQRIITKLKVQLNIMHGVDALFVYSAADEGLICIAAQGKPQSQINDTIVKLAQNGVPDMRKWFPYQVGQERYMFRYVKYNSQVTVGAAMSAGSLVENMPVWNEVQKQGINLLTDDWGLLVKTGFAQDDLRAIRDVGIQSNMFQTVQGTKRGSAPFQLVGKHLNQAALSVVYTIPEKRLLANLPNFQRLINLIPWVTVLITVFYVLFIQQILLKPMKQLIKGMHKIKKGDWAIRLPEDPRTREFATLNVTFNQMAEEIHALKMEAYEKQLQAQEARFKHLQAQINPHFFMNALNISYSLAGLREYQLVQKLLAHIVDFLRFITRNNGELVTIDQELGHIRHYLEIQKLRFPNRLDYEYIIDDRCGRLLIPPLIVQPVVENAVIHGFKMESGMFIIRIKVAMREDQRLEITVQDNGIGFTTAQVDSWQRGEELPGAHIGIRNMMERIAIKYSTGAEVAFENAAEGGALVRLLLPAAEMMLKEAK